MAALPSCFSVHMKSCRVWAISAAFVILPVQANQALAQKNACLSCHALERKVVGPAFQEVARRYAGKLEAPALAQRIKSGGAGHWGVVAMPSQDRLSEADAQVLARWILSGAR